jgi:subtilase-type serine protease
MRYLLNGAGLSALMAFVATAQAQPAPHANQYGLGLIGAPAAWAAGYTGNGIIVAVGDTGIELTHPAFAGKIDPRGRNYVLPAPGAAYDVNQYAESDPKGHGTHVSGIIASAAGSGVPGVAYNASILALRMTPGCPKGQNCAAAEVPNASAAAINYFAGLNDVTVYNASYGPDSGTGRTSWPASLIDPEEKAAVLAAIGRGKIIVAANGNDRAENPVAGLHPNGIALYPYVRPANAGAGVYQDGNNNHDFSDLLRQPGLVMAVASVGQAKVLATYSQGCGATASWCVAAPGGNTPVDDGIYSTLPNAAYGYEQGTSMAAPMVSGALAVLQQAYPGYGARDLAHVLFATAENIGGQAGLNATYGYGLIRLDRGVAGPVTLAAGAAIDVAAQQVTYWSQPLTTGGAFAKTGAGSLIVAGRTTATGDVTVHGGALGVGGTLTLQGKVQVAQGARLAGFGRIVGNALIDGTLSPGQLANYADLAAGNGGAVPAGIPLNGTSLGTLTVQGVMTLTGTATLEAGIDGAQQMPGGPGTFDKIIVTGAGSVFNAGGTLAPLLRDNIGGANNYSPALGTAFAIVTGENGGAVAGQFAQLAQPAAGLAANTRFDVVYSATSVTLNVTPLNFQALAAQDNLNPNQQAVAGALDAVRPQPGVRARSTLAPSFDDLYDDDLEEFEDDLAQLSGQGIAANAGAVLNAYAGFAGAIAARRAIWNTALPAERLAQNDSGATASDAAQGLLRNPVSDRWMLWAQGFGRWSQVGDTNALPGADMHGSGAMIGADRAFTPELTAGAALGYFRSVTESFAAYARSDSFAAALYATWMRGNFVLDGQLAAGPTTTGTWRIVQFLGATDVRGTADGWGAAGTARAGYRFDLAGAVLQPFAGFSVTNLHHGAYGETTDIGLDFPSQDFTRMTSSLGAELHHQFQLDGLFLRPQASIAWSHDLQDGGLTTRTALFDAPFEIDAAPPGRDAAAVRFTLSAWWTENFSLFAGYNGEFRRNATAHEARIGITLGL